MIITAEEYYEMGFPEVDSKLLESCLKLSEYMIAGICENRHKAALALGGEAADYIKQAAAFQTRKLIEQETVKAVPSESSSKKSSEKITIGDYSCQTSSETSDSVGSYTPTASDSSVCDMSMQTIRLLRASGCLFGGVEVYGDV